MAIASATAGPEQLHLVIKNSLMVHQSIWLQWGVPAGEQGVAQGYLDNKIQTSLSLHAEALGIYLQLRP